MFGVIVQVFLLSNLISAFLYFLFFRYSSIIWSFNPVVNLKDFMPVIQAAIIQGQSGIETQLLYIMMFLNMGFSVFLYAFVLKVKNENVKKILFLSAFVVVALYFLKIGFVLPPSRVEEMFSRIMLTFLMLVLSIILFLNKRRWITEIFFAVVLFLVCFIPYQGYSLRDLTFILTPALRIINGYSLNESYFEYNYFLSLLGALWIKLNLSIYFFPILGQSAYYAFLLGLYFFAKKYFLDKRLAPLLVLALIVFKMYGIHLSNTGTFQCTPLRLDMWFLLVLFAYWKGLKHWSLGIILGLLIMFHFTFGIIYSVTYLILLGILFFIDIYGRQISLWQRVKKHWLLYNKNIIIIFFSFLIYKIFLSPNAAEAAFSYQKYNLGFLRISINSFYWYFPGIFSSVIILLLRNRPAREENITTDEQPRLSTKYFHVGIFLVLLAIGNSIYFFGRSYEGSIQAIAGSLFFVLYLFLDLVQFELNKNQKSIVYKVIVPSLAVCFILILSYFYAGRIIDRLKYQKTFIAKGRSSFAEYYRNPIDLHIEEVKRITRGSEKITFISKNDFFYYYDGGYVPQGFNCFTYSFLLKKDAIAFWESQINNGYYLVIPVNEFQFFIEVLLGINHDNVTTRTPNFIVIYNPEKVF